MLDAFLQFADQHQDYFYWAAVASGVLFIIGALATPYLIGLIPSDYFVQQKNYKFQIHGFWHGIGLLVRTFFGLILFLAGVIMLFTPGQGILSMVIGLSLMEFPGKHKLEYQLASHDPTFNALNWLRKKANKPPLER